MNVLPSRLALLLLLTLATLLTACGGGGSPAPDPVPDPDPHPPAVTGIFPKDLAARSGSTVRFVAQVSSQASSYKWQFGPGAVPHDSNFAQPLVTLDVPGTHTGLLTVCNADCATPFPFTYTVVPEDSTVATPRIVSVSPSGFAGARGSFVTFSAVVDGSADSFQWDFGTGAEPRLHSTATPQVLLLKQGLNNGELSVGTSGGGIDTFPFVYEVGPGVLKKPPTNLVVTSRPPWACDNKNIKFIATADSEIPVTFEWSFTGGVTPLLTTNSVARVHTGNNVDGLFQFTVKARNEMGVSPQRQYAYSITPCPDVSGSRLTGTHLVGGPVFIKTTMTGISQGLRKDYDPGVLEINTFNDSTFELMTAPPGTVSGNYSAWRFLRWGAGDTVQFQIPVTAAPGLPPVWSDVFGAPLGAGEDATADIGIFEGRPVVVFFNPSLRAIAYSEAQVPDPQQGSDWLTHQVQGTTRFTLEHLALYTNGPVPLIVEQDGSDLRLHRALNGSPSNSSEWTTLDLKSLIGSVERTTSASQLDGNVLMVVQEDDDEMLEMLQTLNPTPNQLSDIDVSTPLPDQPDEQLIAATSWNGRWLVASMAQDHRELRFAHALVTMPQSASDWVSYPLADAADTWDDYTPRLIATDSRAWMFLYPPSDTGAPTEWWTTARAMPIISSDWQQLEPAYGFPASMEMCEVGGRLAGVARPTDRIFYLRALTLNGDAGADWHKQLTPSLDQFADPGALFATCANGNRLYMVTSISTGEDVIDSLRVFTAPISW